jgi:hypothetical protein
MDARIKLKLAEEMMQKQGILKGTKISVFKILTHDSQYN